MRGCIGCAVRSVGDDGDDGVDRRGASGRADGDGSSISGESKKQRRDKIAAAAASERALTREFIGPNRGGPAKS